ncbi:hypothetical protein ACLBR5_19890 [Escherichia coli]
MVSLSSHPVTLFTFFPRPFSGQSAVSFLEFAQVLDKIAYLTVWQGDDVQRRVKGVVARLNWGRTTKTRCCTA